jgi:hypothetical protein
MGDMYARKAIHDAAIKRVNKIEFGDPITNICAGENNPIRLGYFVKSNRRNVTSTDKKGRFSDIGIEVIYPGHLDMDECKRLFHAVWESEYGENKPKAGSDE